MKSNDTSRSDVNKMGSSSFSVSGSGSDSDVKAAVKVSGKSIEKLVEMEVDDAIESEELDAKEADREQRCTGR